MKVSEADGLLNHRTARHRPEPSSRMPLVTVSLPYL